MSVSAGILVSFGCISSGLLVTMFISCVLNLLLSILLLVDRRFGLQIAVLVEMSSSSFISSISIAHNSSLSILGVVKNSGSFVNFSIVGVNWIRILREFSSTLLRSSSSTSSSKNRQIRGILLVGKVARCKSVHRLTSDFWRCGDDFSS